MESNSLKIVKYLLDKGYTMDKFGTVRRPDGSKISGTNDRGYIKIAVRALGFSSYSLKAHKIQAYLKFGEKAFINGIHTRHLNGIRSDNSWENIDIGSASDNMMDIPKKERILNASSPKYDHKSIIDDYNSGFSYKQLMNKYNITSKGTISFIIKRSLASVA